MNGLADRLAGEKRIAGKQRVEAADPGADAGQPVLCRIALAVLLVGAVPGSDELRRQRQGGGLARGDESGAEEAMESLDRLPVGGLVANPWRDGAQTTNESGGSDRFVAQVNGPRSLAAFPGSLYHPIRPSETDDSFVGRFSV